MRKLTIAIFSSLICLSAMAQTSNISGVINTYTKVTGYSNGCSCPSTNCATVTVSSATGFAANDIVLLIQMKGARVDSTNTTSFGNILNLYDAGNYEFDTIASIAGSVITLKVPLRNTYFTNAYLADSAYVQLIKVPVYVNVNVNGALTPQAWDASTGTGGVLAFIASGSVTLNANISADGMGFRGTRLVSAPVSCEIDTAFYYQSTSWNHASCTSCGYAYDDPVTRRVGQAAYGGCGTTCYTNRMYINDNRTAAYRGEGIAANTFKKVFANLNVAYFEKGKGHWGNAGGGGSNHNGGGGGGANYGAGGFGGNMYNVTSTDCPSSGFSTRRGYGGAALTPTGSKIFMGGSGGEGHNNGGGGSAGTSGGGIIIIKAASVTNGASYTISANGTDQTYLGTNDGQGGGGAGGSILMNISGSYTNAVTISAKGGKGGDQSQSSCHGTGGGGGGGVIWFSQSSTPANVTTVVTGGAAGQNVHASFDCGVREWGATAGSSGGLLYNTDPSSLYFLNMNDCNFSLPVELVSFVGEVSEQGVLLQWTTASEINNDHFSIERTEDLMTYATIGDVHAAGNTSVTTSYSFRDDNAPAKELFYRLKQVDFDGKIHYPGRLVRINNQDAGRMPLISPNPNDGRTFTLNLTDCDNNDVTVRIVDNMGKVVWLQNIDLDTYGGDRLITINTGRNFERGIYTVHVSCTSGQQMKRFMINKREE